jgi:predicted transposase YbfD/YdcC
MRIVQYYSHLNGLEYLLVHKPELWKEIITVIEAVDAKQHRTKISQEKTMHGKLLYSPKEMNKSLNEGFVKVGWKESRTSYWVTKDSNIIRNNNDFKT